MCRCLLLASLLVKNARAFAPIQWVGHPTGKFVLSLQALSDKGFVPPQRLVVQNQGDNVPPDVIPLFTANPDKSITWRTTDSTWCIEAGGEQQVGDVVQINHCTGGPAQQWSWMRGGHGQKMIQLKGTNFCLDVIDDTGDSNGASVALRECEGTATESWKFDEPIPLPTQNPSHLFAILPSMRDGALSFIFMAALGALSLSTWLWRQKRLAGARVVAPSDRPTAEQSAVSLTVRKQERILAVMGYHATQVQAADIRGHNIGDAGRLRVAQLGAARSGVVRMGFFDGFFNGVKPPGDRMTPFDRWNSSDFTAAEDENQFQKSTLDESARYVDPNDTENYVTVQIPRPMGLEFVENDGGGAGVYVREVLEDGAAASATPAIQALDQLVAVDSKLALGSSFEEVLDMIKNSPGETTKLIFFRGPTAFLYGPTRPDDGWYSTNLT